MSRRCPRRCLATVEAGCQEEARKKKAEKKRRKRRTVERERKIRNEISQEVVAGTKEKASAHEDAKPTAQRTVGQSVKQHWDCSQIESGEEKRKMRTGKKENRWKCNGLRIKNCNRSLNEEERKEVPCRQKSCKRYLNWQYMSGCPKVKNERKNRKEKVKG